MATLTPSIHLGKRLGSFRIVHVVVCLVSELEVAPSTEGYSSGGSGGGGGGGGQLALANISLRREGMSPLNRASGI
jgi:hypothetical protein